MFKKFGEVFYSDPAFENIRKTIKNAEITERFHEIFPGLEEHVAVTKFRNGVLSLYVDNSVLKHELKSNDQLMINRINTWFKEEVVTEIKFVNKV